MLITPDVSEFQVGMTDAYPRPAVIFRGAFGTWKMDDRFLVNAGAAKRLWDAGKLRGGAVVYQVPLIDATAKQTCDYLWRLIGPKVPDWLTGIMLDVESWRGTSYEVRGDQSARFNTLYGLNAHRMGSWKACKGYANWGDMQALWPRRDPRCEYVEANYGPVMPTRPGKVGQQYTDGSGRWSMPKGMPASTVPFGNCDHNAFPGINDAAGFRRAWGRPTWAEMHGAPVVVPPVVKPAPGPLHAPVPHYNVKRGNSLVSPDGSRAVFFSNDGRLEVRHNGQHQAWITEG